MRLAEALPPSLAKLRLFNGTIPGNYYLNRLKSEAFFCVMFVCCRSSCFTCKFSRYQEECSAWPRTLDAWIVADN